jgi:YVTN family beta-propeller protein
MNMKNIFPAIFFLITAGYLLWIPSHKWARNHVNEQTGVNDHPLLCTSCHLYITKNPFISIFTSKKYFSPINIAENNGTLYVVAQDKDLLIEIDARTSKIKGEIKTGNHPHSVVIESIGKRAYVTNQWSDNVSVIDLESRKVISAIKTSGGPAGLCFSKDEEYLYVVNSYTSDISVISVNKLTEVNRISAGNNPTGAALSPDGRVFITSRRANISSYGDTLESELTVLNDGSQRVMKRIMVESAYMIENICFTPEGDLALFTLVRPKNLVPSIQVEQGFMMTYGLGVIELKNNDRITQLLIDEPNSYYSDPFDIVISKNGKEAFISSSGVDRITVVSIDSIRKLIDRSKPEMLRLLANYPGISNKYVTGRIITGANPKGMVLSDDGSTLYVSEMLNDRITGIETRTHRIKETIELSVSGRITVARRGRRLLNSSGHTFQNQYSCYTCHPDGHEDGLVYNMASKDMGRNVTNTQSLRDIAETAPFKWNGKNLTVYRQDGIRFSTVLTRTEQFSYRDLDAIVSYIMTGIDYPPNLQYNADGILTEAQLRGKEIFERVSDKAGNPIQPNNRCVVCHPPPYYTNRQPADVNTLSKSDDSILFDTPHLNNIFASPPYLHDGRAATLEEIWTIYGNSDKHGRVGDLTKAELNDLVEYLKSLRAPEYEHRKGKNKSDIYASFK